MFLSLLILLSFYLCNCSFKSHSFVSEGSVYIFFTVVLSTEKEKCNSFLSAKKMGTKERWNERTFKILFV